MSADDRCRSVDGVHIPGCIGCAVFGHRAGCTCTPRSHEDTIARLERRIARLEKLAGVREKAPFEDSHA